MNRNTFFMAAMMVTATLAGCSKDDGDNTSGGKLAAKTELNLSYGNDPAQKLDLYLPEGRSETSTKMAVLIHGGAWLSGDKGDPEMKALVDSLRRNFSDYAIANLNYRLATFAGGNAWPVQMTDVNNAINSLLNNGSNYQVNMNKMVIIGASAGAQLGLIRAYNFNTNNHVKAMVNLFGPTDLADLYANPPNPQYPQLLQVFMSGTPASNPANYASASPLTMVGAGDPPTITFHGTADATVPVRQSDSLHARLQRAGVVSQYTRYPGLGHGDWPAATFSDAFTRSFAFIRQYNP